MSEKRFHSGYLGLKIAGLLLIFIYNNTNGGAQKIAIAISIQCPPLSIVVCVPSLIPLSLDDVIFINDITFYAANTCVSGFFLPVWLALAIKKRTDLSDM